MDTTKAEHVNLIVTDPDETASTEYNDAQPPVVLQYHGADAPALERAASSKLTLKQLAVRSSLWTLTAFAAGQVIRVFSQPIQAAYLTPAMFGVVNLVSIFVTGLQAMSDVGVEQAIIQNKRGDERVFLDTAWTIHAIRGIGLWLGSCLIAFPVFWFYRSDPAAHYILYLLPVAGLGPMFTGFNSTAVFTLNRHLQMGRLTIFGLGYQIVTVSVSIGIAIFWASPWAIVIGGVCSNAAYMVASHYLIPGYRNRFCWDPEVRAELMKIGRWIMVSTLITYTGMQIDRLMMPKFLNMEWLGLYGIAAGLVMLPREVIARLASVTLFPALSRAAEQKPEDLARVFFKARSLILSASVGTTLGVILGAPIFFTLFYRPDYHPAGWLAQLASVSGWFILLQVSADRALLALGRTKPLAVSNAVNLAITVVGALAGRWIDMACIPGSSGISGFLLGLAAGKLAGHLMIQIELARCGMSIFRQDLAYSALLLAASLVGVLLPKWLPGYDAHKVFVEAATGIAVCGVICAWASLRVLRGIR